MKDEVNEANGLEDDSFATKLESYLGKTKFNFLLFALILIIFLYSASEFYEIFYPDSIHTILRIPQTILYFLVFATIIFLFELKEGVDFGSYILPTLRPMYFPQKSIGDKIPGTLYKIWVPIIVLFISFASGSDILLYVTEAPLPRSKWAIALVADLVLGYLVFTYEYLLAQYLHVFFKRVNET